MSYRNGSTWSREMNEHLIVLLGQGLTRYQIVDEMEINIQRVTQKLNFLEIDIPLGTAPEPTEVVEEYIPVPLPNHVWFDDITKAEAREISGGIRSAKFTKTQIRYSEIGNGSAMCAL